jgi:glycosyltransferase involved in cell wall biosynthesis
MHNRILLVSPTPSHPQNAGNRTRIYQLAEHLRSLGADISFILIDMEAGTDYEGMRSYFNGNFSVVKFDPAYPSFYWRLRDLLGFKHSFGTDLWYPQSLDVEIRNLMQKITFDMVIVEYIFLSRCLNIIDNRAIKVIDTHDVFSNRNQILASSGITDGWFSTTRQQEIMALKRANVVVAITDTDREFFAKRMKRQVITIGHLMQVPENTYSVSNKKSIVFIGSDNPINIQGLHYFLAEILPIVKQRVPSVDFLMAGNICQRFPDHEAYTKLGRVADLSSVYARGSVVICPTLSGTGLSIKTLEALAHGMPVVTTSIGARGLLERGKNAFLIADEPKPFAEAIIKILNDPNFARSLSKKGHQFVIDYTAGNLKTLQDLLNANPVNLS